MWTVWRLIPVGEATILTKRQARCKLWKSVKSADAAHLVRDRQYDNKPRARAKRFSCGPFVIDSHIDSRAVASLSKCAAFRAFSDTSSPFRGDLPECSSPLSSICANRRQSRIWRLSFCAVRTVAVGSANATFRSPLGGVRDRRSERRLSIARPVSGIENVYQ